MKDAEQNLYNAWAEGTTESFRNSLTLACSQLKKHKVEQPVHWSWFTEALELYEPKSVLDVGCSTGYLYQLCRRTNPNVIYTGVDFAQSAIDIASEKWGSPRQKGCSQERYGENLFLCADVMKMPKEDFKKYEMVLFCGVLSVLPNADHYLSHILSLDIDLMQISRVSLTKNESYYKTYDCYQTESSEIKTCEFHHNESYFLSQIEKNGYEILSRKQDGPENQGFNIRKKDV